MPVNMTVPADIEQRIAGLGDVLARTSDAIDFVYLFGSRSLGQPTPRSDVDIAIHVSGVADPSDVRLEAIRAASAHLATDAVDLVLLNGAPIALAGRILITRRVLFDRRPFVRHMYESRTARLFHDFRIREHRILSQRFGHG